MARLGVNIDHVATLRQQRGESYPSLVDAAYQVLDIGADQITIHLREDRRHIQDPDVPAVKMVCERFNKPLNLELGIAPDILEIACEVTPEWICIVPEKREERTTEGGLNLIDQDSFNRIKSAIELLRNKTPQSKISLFVECDKETLLKCIELKVDAVEIHTGDYAIAFNEENSIEEYLKNYAAHREMITSAGMGYHAGHGLTDRSLVPLIENKLFEEYNIGHWIICDAVFNGIKASTEKLLKMCKGK
jgi:pyridoxine 5-phosphate synthase